jgi:hypothetical protein
MPEVRELEARLAALRREVTEAKLSGYTPSQIRKLQAECWQLWAAVERYKHEHLFDLIATRQ